MTYTRKDFLDTVRADFYEGVTHAGLAVVAADTGRVLLAQRAMDETDDPDVQETWEFPGGGLDEGEDPLAGAFREFAEEVEDVGLPDFGEVVGGWRAPDGIYQGFVIVVPDEGLTHGEEPAEWFRPNDEVQRVDWFSREIIKVMGAKLRPEMADTPWDMIFGSVSRNEDSTMDDMDEAQQYAAIFVAPIPIHGIAAPEEVEAGDGRVFAANSITKRPLRLPFRDTITDIGSHDGAFVVGSVDRLMRADGMVHWEGLLMPAAATESIIERMVFFGGRYGVSIDGDQGRIDARTKRDANNKIAGPLWFEQVRMSGLTAVDIPAFHQAHVAFGYSADMPSEDALTASAYESGDLIGGRVTFDRGPGWATNPKETKSIHDYWTKKGEPGYAKIAWGTPGDFTRAKALIGEKIAKHSPDKMKYLNQIIAQWHHDALGYWPGDWDKPGNDTTAEGRAKRGAKKTVKAGSSLDVQQELFGEAYQEGRISEVGVTERGAIRYDLAEALRGLDRRDIVPDLVEDSESVWEAVLVSSADAGDRARPDAAYFERHPDTNALVIEEPDAFGFRRTHGYAAEWGVCHIGYEGRCVEPPRKFSDEYPEFHLGRTKTTDGYINTGVLTYNVGHRDAETILSESPTQAHFDNLLNAWATVRLGEDDRGVWFSGVVLPKVDEDDIVKIQASGQVSGEWKRGELRACLAVNTSGFPVIRASAVYGEDGEVLALSASAFTNTLTASVNGVGNSPCAPTPGERLAALRLVDAEIRFSRLREMFYSEKVDD